MMTGVDVKVEHLQRPAAEVRFAAELARLRETDTDDRPPGWALSLTAARRFVVGADELGVTRKFVGDPSLIDRALVTLATSRGLMLVGEPGTAKSLLSELLAAAVSGGSTLTIQGGAATTEDQIKYSWNYALLVAEGPSTRSLVPAPMLRGMAEGKLVRFEEITRCPLEVQDCLLSLLSDRVLAIPELTGPQSMVYARDGFNVIATANTRDRGVNEMSAALKRRFNYVAIPVVSDVEQEAQIVERRSRDLLGDLASQIDVPPDVVRLLTAVFAELRRGETLDGTAKVKSPTTVLSTAELISVVASGALMGSFFGEGRATVRDCFSSLVGTVAKENQSDLEVLREYLETVARPRTGRLWQEFYAAGQDVLP
jgi:MoxR-like ATPase